MAEPVKPVDALVNISSPSCGKLVMGTGHNSYMGNLTTSILAHLGGGASWQRGSRPASPIRVEMIGLHSNLCDPASPPDQFRSAPDFANGKLRRIRQVNSGGGLSVSYERGSNSFEKRLSRKISPGRAGYLGPSHPPSAWPHASASSSMGDHGRDWVPPQPSHTRLHNHPELHDGVIYPPRGAWS